MDFTLVWLGVALLMTLCSVAYTAWTGESEPGELIMIMVVVALMWPAILAMIAIVVPFYILYYLVHWLRSIYDALHYSSEE